MENRVLSMGCLFIEGSNFHEQHGICSRLFFLTVLASNFAHQYGVNRTGRASTCHQTNAIQNGKWAAS